MIPVNLTSQTFSSPDTRIRYDYVVFYCTSCYFYVFLVRFWAGKALLRINLNTSCVIEVGEAVLAGYPYYHVDGCSIL
jgi:hypothetical protein